MEIIKITPRGYCHGVVNALNIVSEAIYNKNNPLPIYILGEIVHNNMITKALAEKNVISLKGISRQEILNKVDHGTVIITAHGISPKLIQIAKDKGLKIIDATCSDVYKTHDLIKEKIQNNFEVLYIGKENHPEPEGAIGINPKHIHLITGNDDIDKFISNFKGKLNGQKVCITNQTTMSKFDVKDIMDYAKHKIPGLEIINELCSSTTMRQEAAFNLAKEADLTIVVGDPNSNNTNQLVKVSQKSSNAPAHRILTIEDIKIEWLLDTNIKKVAITSGASTPTQITQEVITFIEQFDPKDQSTWNNKSKINLERLIPRNKNKK